MIRSKSSAKFSAAEASSKVSSAAPGPSQPQRGGDLRYDLEITLEEAALGCEKEISVSKLDRCDACNGSGMEHGSKIRTCSTCGGRGRCSRRAVSLASRKRARTAKARDAF